MWLHFGCVESPWRCFLHVNLMDMCAHTNSIDVLRYSQLLILMMPESTKTNYYINLVWRNIYDQLTFSSVYTVYISCFRFKTNDPFTHWVTQNTSMLDFLLILTIIRLEIADQEKKKKHKTKLKLVRGTLWNVPFSWPSWPFACATCCKASN